MSAARNVRVEVVFATPGRQFLQTCSVPCGSSVADAIAGSKVLQEFPDLKLKSHAVGVWGTVVELSKIVDEGDRIEIYRPLPVDPRDARRQHAVDGGFMGKPRSVTDQD
jgi:putative ubiquitin-RnfH superfamily antitoxin RatB of RatAB toxin-antitoxin module